MKFKPNNRGFYDVRRMPKLIDELEAIAEEKCAKANAELDGGEHFKTGSRQGARRPQGRWRTSVYTADSYARRADAKHNILLKVLY